MAKALTFMDEQNIAMKLLSMTGALDADQARQWNRQTAAIVAAHPDRLSLLAALPVATPELAIADSHLLSRDLNADGFVVASNYGGV